MSGLALFGNVASAQVFVDQNAPPGGDGTSWATAYLTVQEGIDNASPGDDVLVAEGVYYPTTEMINGFTARHLVIRLQNEVNLRGGFLGLAGGAGASTDADDPDGLFRLTVLSGDIGVGGDASDNCYHVLYVDNNSGFAPMEIDGFRIMDGFADDTGDEGRAGGLFVDGLGASLRVENVIFRDNYAAEAGGGVYASPGQDELEFAFCRFRGNWADEGGAIYGYIARAMDIGNCLFRDNGSYTMCQGGSCDPTTLPSRGGAIFLDNECVVTVSNTVFHDNVAFQGSAVYINPIDWSASGDYRNYWHHCTFGFNFSNFPGTGAAFYVDGDDPDNGADTDQFLYNTIFWDDETGHPDIIVGDNIDITVEYSNWDFDTTGSTGNFVSTTGSISGDPVFKGPASRNLRLSNVASNLSPCMNAGLAGLTHQGADVIDTDDDDDFDEVLPLDKDLFSRIFYNAPDMGAFEVSALIR